MARQPSPEERAFAENQQDQDDEREYHKRVSGAIDDTEREIFRHGSAKSDEEVAPDPEDDGDRSLEEPDEDIAGGDPEDEEEEQQDDEQPEQQARDGEQAEEGDEEPEQGSPQRDERSDRFVPSNRLREERERAERLERELAETRARLQAPIQQAPAQPPPEPPDMFVDPKGWEQVKLQEFRQAAQRDYTERSLAAAHQEYGDDFAFVYSTLQGALQRGDTQAAQITARILNAPDPGRALMTWGEQLLSERQDQQEETHRQWLRETYGDEVAEQLERQAMRRSNPRQGQTVNRPATPPRRSMPSLNSAGSSGGQRARIDPRGIDGSEEAIFNDVFAPPQR